MKTHHLLFVSACIAAVRAACPQFRKDAACTCTESKTGPSLLCVGPNGADDLYSFLATMTASARWELQLESLELQSLPPSTQNVTSLSLVRSNISNLQQPWPKMTEMVIDSVFEAGGLWPQLKTAHQLRSLKITSFSMPTIGSEFRNSVGERVVYLDLRKTETNRLEAGAMNHLKNLVYLLLVDMPLEKFPRNVLPMELPKLHTFILGNTKIEKLEEAFFEGMPSLEVLMLNGNRLTTLDSQLFTPLESHLTHLLAERNPLICECSLTWINENLQKKQSIRILATCYDNTKEEFREVTTLDEMDFC